ncbi:class II fructose-1,6-bisphosphate aldolase [Weissella ceti]|uniref:Class II fructose-1,6-bisphosphate aldolase n=1 Tax=Weissella ceti TaxID=759620 RepID=A0ABT3E329_9LACO|nr:class II fructose-1,6-bisphosphate aldolase [Weissella ceti]MCW0952750.1 class II fructose-1,6-bisphosphate aldolase [Weissella ceti]QVK12449.1 class II fructose-1,6-bisphosphate aldolase [Weissella ceti]
MITSSTEMLKKARANGYAVPAFNVNNLEWVKAILMAAEKTQSPVIIQVTGGAAKYMSSFKVARDLVVDIHDALKMTVPVAIHVDHGTFEEVQEGTAVGFTSAMFDGSSLPIDENVRKTMEVAKTIHAKNMSLEGEVGTIGGEEDGIVADGEIAPVADAVRMAEAGVDMLAVGIGNIHGPYPEDWKGLDFKHLEDISKAVKADTGKDLPFVLHGGSGIPDEQIQKAISLGVAKINVNTEGQLAFHKATREFVLSNKDLEGKNYDPRKFLLPGTEAIEAMAVERINVFGSANKA